MNSFDRIFDKVMEKKSASFDDIFNMVNKSKGCINGLKYNLYPFQVEGVDFLNTNKGSAILSFSMGLGKTVTSIAYSLFSNRKKVLVICPASVKYSWQSEVTHWTSKKAFVINSSTGISDKNFNSNDFFIINYDILKKFLGEMLRYKFDYCIIDEFQYIKNGTAQRTKLAKSIARNIGSITLLSGTPVLSRPMELYNALNLIDPMTWNNWRKFAERYCDATQTMYGWDVTGASNVKELQSRISKYFIRRAKEEVLKDLPPKIKIPYPINMDKEFKDKYEIALKKFVEFLLKFKGKNVAQVRKIMQAEKLVKIGELRKLTTWAKLENCKELIDNIIDSGEKVIVFSCYVEPLAKLMEYYKKNSVILTGSIDAKQRSEIVNKFQTDKNIKIFFGGIKSAGVGITLTAATNVIFLDYSWVPADHDQAEDRAHRIGTINSVNIYQLYCLNTIDEYMQRVLMKKRVIVDSIIGGKYEKDSDSVINGLIEMIEGEMSSYL